MLLIDVYPPEFITNMLENDDTIGNHMLKLREDVGIDSFIAIVNHMPTGKLMLDSDKHIYNWKYIEEHKAFIRIDEESPRPQTLEFPN